MQSWIISCCGVGTEGPGGGEVELCTDEESLLSLVLGGGAQDGVQEARFMVRSRSKFSAVPSFLVHR